MQSPKLPGLVMSARYYQRKDRKDRWVVYLYWKGKHYRRSHYDHNTPLVHEQMAVQVAGAINAAIAQDRAGFDPRQFFDRANSEFLFRNYALWWLKERTGHYAPSVIRDVHRYVQLGIDLLGDKDLREIKGWTLEQTIPRLPGSNKTKKNCITVWAKMFSDAVRMDMIPKAPATPRLEIQEVEIKWLTKEQQEEVLKWIPERDRPIILFMMIYGCRVGEARAIHWEDIDFQQNTIKLHRSFSSNILRNRTKTNTIRYLPLVEPLSSILKKLRGISGPVFRNFYGRPYTAEISRVWREAVGKAGLPPITLYQGTRHSWASQRVNSGVNMELIRDVLGHTSIATTQRYAKVSMDSKRKVIE